jgi:group I intron endonuclease
MRTYYIYKYTNLASDNKKIYIGQCFDIARRKRAHKSAALKESDACPLFYRAIRKYGYESFEFEIIEEIYTDQNGIDEREIHWIKELNAMNNEVGYNISPGGGGRANPNNTDTHKQCPRCNKIKLRTEYTKDAGQHDGIRFCCQECGIKIDQEYRSKLSDEEMERRNKIRRKQYSENPEPYIEAAKKYYEEHKEERAEYKKEYYEKNKEELKQEHKIWRKENKQYVVEKSKNDRKAIKSANEKLTKEEIYARTPIKHCNAKDHDVISTNFYLDLERPDGLGHNCKDCHKAKMAIVRERNRQNK